MNSSDLPADPLANQVPSPHWVERNVDWSFEEFGLSVARPIEPPQASTIAWVSPRTLLFGIYVFAILMIVAFFQLTVSLQLLQYPTATASVMIGSIFGILIATQSWDLGTRWTTFLRLVSGLTIVQTVYPVFAKQLGGPAAQWWSALVLLMLTSQTINSILNQRLSFATDRSGSKQSHVVSWFSLGLVDLLSFSCLLGIVFQLGKYAFQFPAITLQCFAWFGGFATIISITRFSLTQIGRIWSSYRKARMNCLIRPQQRDHAGSGKVTSQSRSTIVLNVFLEIAGILLVVAAIDVAIYLWLHQSRGDSPSVSALLVILLMAQIWQALDLWVQHLLLLQKTKRSLPHYRIDAGC